MNGYTVLSQYFAYIISVPQKGWISEEILYKLDKLFYHTLEGG